MKHSGIHLNILETKKINSIGDSMTKKGIVVRVPRKMSRRDAILLIGGGLVAGVSTYKLAKTPIEKLVDKLYNNLGLEESKEEIPEGYYVQFSANLNKEYAENNKSLLEKLGFGNTVISKEKVNGKTYYKTLIGLYKNQEPALEIGEKILEKDNLVDLLGYPEINVIKLKYEEGLPKTDWSGTILIQKKVKLEKDKEKLKEYGKKTVETKLGKKSIDDLIEKVVSEWNEKNNTRYNLDVNLIRAIVWEESRYKTDRAGYKLKHLGNGKFGYLRNEKGERILSAYGLMQVTEDAAKEMGYEFEDVVNDPLTNLRAGADYFGKYLIYFKGDVDRTLGAYNAGPGRAMKNKHLKYEETRQYIKKVNAQKEFYVSQMP